MKKYDDTAIRDKPFICWNCNREYDSFMVKHGGVIGECHRCEGLHWVLAPSVLEAAGVSVGQPNDTLIVKSAVQKIIKEIKSKREAA